MKVLHIMKLPDFNRRIETFASKVHELYDPLTASDGIAEHLDYYVFQTAVRPEPELLVMGINPGGNSKKGLREAMGRTDTTYNAYFDDVEHSWFLTLRRIFGTPLLTQQLRDCVGTNKYFINTGNAKKLPENKYFERNAVLLARELVDEVIRPKRIVTLGRDVFFMLKHSPLEMKRFGKVRFKYGHRGDMPVCQIYNPSPINANRYYTEDWIGDWHKALEWFLTEAK